MNPLPIDPELIPIIFHWVVTLLCVALCLQYSSSENCDNLLKQNSSAGMIIVSLLFVLFLGMRPIWWGFGDTVTYARTYRAISNTAIEIDWSKEWLFAAIRALCKSLGFTVTMFFLVIELGYIGLMVWAFQKALWENLWFAVLFALSAFSFFTYGVNGMRNGLACSFVLLAMIFAAKDKNIVTTVLLSVMALGIHKSTMLPIAALVAAMYIIKNPKLALMFWVMSIPLSLVAGGPISNFFMGLGFDDRAEAYMSGDNAKYGNFSNTGFRWDFLLYSAMPVWLIWIVQKKVEEKRLAMGGGKTIEEEESGVYGAGILADAQSMRVYNVLSVVYLLSNAFWVMVIKASFSNRFAYLSWFMYPLVLAYIVIRIPIWKDQDRKAGWILLAHAAFTQFMFMIGKL